MSRSTTTTRRTSTILKMRSSFCYAEVILSISAKETDRTFSYAVPPELRDRIRRGMRVLVPFGAGNRRREAYVIGLSDATALDQAKIKQIERILDDRPALGEKTLELAFWMKEKYYTTLANCLRCVLPAGVKEREEGDLAKTVRYACLNAENPETAAFLSDPRGLGAAQTLVMQALLQGEAPAAGLKAALNISDSPLKTLEKKNLIRIYEKSLPDGPLSGARTYDKTPERPVLTREQENAAAVLCAGLRGKNPKPTLICGVTGSGKTEVYLRVIEDAVAAGKQAIMLVPEISLTPQTVEAFIRRLGGSVAVTHSRLTPLERYGQWKKARDGEVSVMIGPRSAVFAPFENLGCIIVDEEHESVYKSETAPKYSAKEVAIKRAEQTGALAVFGSATPSVESFRRTETGEFDLLTMTERINGMFPRITVVDMRLEMAEGNMSLFSRAFAEALGESIRKGEQSILFLNRRGHSTFVSCRRCGNVLRCENCSVNYTYHIHDDLLVCHYCGKRAENPSLCPACGSRFIRYFGVGTQKVEEELRKLFPGVGVIRMDTDTTSGKGSHEALLRAFREQKAQVLLGTQMIAKGLDFPKVTLVGVLAADLSLHTGDFRSGETTFQLLTQVAGRAGRASAPGEVYIQTYNPEHYAIRYAKEQDYRGFYEHEIVLRRQMDYPPFTHVFSVMFTGENEKRVILALHKLLEIMIYCNRKGLFEILGPAPAIVSRIKRKYRWKILVKAKDEARLLAFAEYCVGKMREKAKADMEGLDVYVTMDPEFQE